MNKFETNHDLINRLDDYIRSYRRSQRNLISDFLALYQLKIAQDYLRNKIDFEVVPNDESLSKCIAFGKYDNQLVTLKGLIQTNGQKITQRNIYGAIMGLNIAQSKIGDVWLEDEIAYVTTFRSLADDIIYNCNSLGKATISFSALDELKSPVYRFDKHYVTVSSMRLDSIVKAAVGISRDKAQQMIKAGNVHINFEEINFSTANVECNDILSIRGKGRYKIGPDTHQTKAGKVGLDIYRYL